MSEIPEVEARATEETTVAQPWTAEVPKEPQEQQETEAEREARFEEQNAAWEKLKADRQAANELKVREYKARN